MNEREKGQLTAKEKLLDYNSNNMKKKKRKKNENEEEKQEPKMLENNDNINKRQINLKQQENKNCFC